MTPPPHVPTVFTQDRGRNVSEVSPCDTTRARRRGCYLAASQRPVAAPREGLGAVVGGVDDDAVAVVSVLPQGVGDVPDGLVHRGHHGGELPPGDVGHVSVGVDVGLGGLQRSVNRLQERADVKLRSGKREFLTSLARPCAVFTYWETLCDSIKRLKRKLFQSMTK